MPRFMLLSHPSWCHRPTNGWRVPAATNSWRMAAAPSSWRMAAAAARRPHRVRCGAFIPAACSTAGHSSARRSGTLVRRGPCLSSEQHVHVYLDVHLWCSIHIRHTILHGLIYVTSIKVYLTPGCVPLTCSLVHDLSPVSCRCPATLAELCSACYRGACGCERHERACTRAARAWHGDGTA